MPIKLDISPCSVVVFCTDCTHWRAFQFTVRKAHESAVQHEEQVHPGARQAYMAAAMWARTPAARRAG